MQSLLDILAPDVVALSDGGGVKQAVLRPIVGADRVARLLAAGLDMVGVVALRIDDGFVTGLYYVRNPEKLSRVERETAVSR
jgi:hypothetical protein